MKSLDWFNCAKDIRTGWIKRYGTCFIQGVAELCCGKIYEIENIIDDKFYSIKEGSKYIQIFEYVVDIKESALLNNIVIPVIEKGKYPGYPESDERTLHEIEELVIYKINHNFRFLDADPIHENWDKFDDNTNEIKEPLVRVKKKAGRPKGSKNTNTKVLVNIENKLKLEKNELVICWFNKNKTDFCLGLYQSITNNVIDVLVGDKIKHPVGISKYSKDEFEKITADAVSQLRNIYKDFDKLNNEIELMISSFEKKYNVKIKYEKCILENGII